MNKIVFLIAFLASVQSLHAQYHTEISGRYLFESFSSGETVENHTAAGLEISMGYFFTKKISNNLSFEKIWYKPFSNGLNLSFHNIKTSANYDFLSNGVLTLYVGVGIGYFWEKFKADNISLYQDDEVIGVRKDSYLGWFPLAGARIPVISEMVLLNISLSHYFHNDKSGRIDNWHNIKIGIRYHW